MNHPSPFIALWVSFAVFVLLSVPAFPLSAQQSPTVTACVARQTSFEVIFSTRMDQASVQNPSNYLLDHIVGQGSLGPIVNRLNVTRASYSSSAQKVTLSFTPTVPSQASVRLAVLTRVRDEQGNAVRPPTNQCTATVIGPVLPPDPQPQVRPRIDKAKCSESPVSFDVAFTKPMRVDQAIDAGRYRIGNPTASLGIRRIDYLEGSNIARVQLIFTAGEPPQPGSMTTVTVSSVEDRWGNPLDPPQDSCSAVVRGTELPPPPPGGPPQGQPTVFSFRVPSIGYYDWIDLLTLISDIVDWLIALAAPLLTLMVIIGGIYMLTAAASPQNAATGRTIIIAAIIGFIIIILAKGIAETLKALFQ